MQAVKYEKNGLESLSKYTLTTYLSYTKSYCGRIRLNVHMNIFCSRLVCSDCIKVFAMNEDKHEYKVPRKRIYKNVIADSTLR